MDRKVVGLCLFIVAVAAILNAVLAIKTVLWMRPHYNTDCEYINNHCPNPKLFHCVQPTCYVRDAFVCCCCLWTLVRGFCGPVCLDPSPMFPKVCQGVQRGLRKDKMLPWLLGLPLIKATPPSLLYSLVNLLYVSFRFFHLAYTLFSVKKQAAHI